MNIERTFKAVMIAPWASLVPVAYVLAEHFITTDADVGAQPLGTLFVVGMLALGSVGTAYIAVVAIGLPIHWGLSRLGLRHCVAYLAIGTATGLLWEFAKLVGSEMPLQLQQAGYLSHAMGALLVSFAFWNIAVDPHNKVTNNAPLAPDAAKPRRL